MPQFSRVLRSFNRTFPGTGVQGPNRVSDFIQLISDITRPSIQHDCRLTVDRQVAATGGVTTTLTHAEPPAGFFSLPIIWGAFYDGAVSIRCEGSVVATATTPLDPWGRWDSTNRVVCSIATKQNFTQLLPAIPFGLGSQLRVTWFLPAAATNVEAILWHVLCPAELVNLDLWRVSFTNTVSNSPV